MSAMKHMPLLLPLLFLGLDVVAFTYGKDKFIYSGFAHDSLTLDGAAMVTANGLLDLTNGSVRLNGHAFYQTPLRFRKFLDGAVQSFSTSFVFGIQSIYPSQGFTFFIAPSKNFSSAMPIQYLGLLNSQNNGDMNNHIFAVELDSIKTVEFQDINNNHIGIDINSLISMESYPAGFYDDTKGTFSNLTMTSGKAMQVWVDYNGEVAQINVTMAPMGTAKPIKPLGSAFYNLSTLLTEKAYVGFSSSAGRDNTRHYILGWSFGMNSPAPSIDVSKLPKMPRFGPKARPRYLEIILPIATAAFVLAMGTAIFLLVRRHLRYSELREEWEVEFGPHRFSYKDLFHATEGFKNKNLLGIGGFGRVYKGVLPVSKLEIAFTYGEDKFIYSGFAHDSLTLDGAAMVTANGLLDLTNGSVKLNGHAFYQTPLRFRKSSDGAVQSFSTSFVFGIQSTYPSQGFTFFIAPSKDFSSAMPIQFLGLLNSQNSGDRNNRIFAVELDSIKNFEFHDINNNHIGIDINSLISVESYPAGFYDDTKGIFSNLTITSGKAMQVWVDYNGEMAQINVTMAPMGTAKPIKPLGSSFHNLSTVLTEKAYVGFSSSAGVDNTRHYILGWSFGMNSPAPSIDVSKLPKMPRFGPKARPRYLEIILPIATAAFVLAMGTAIFLLVRRHLRYSELREEWEVEFGPHRFSYRDLFHATEGFKNKNLLGIGGFGRVYKGVLPVSKLEIAVKRVSHDSKQGMKEFVAEVVSIGRLQDRNLVQLLGYCRRKGELLLVYGYMPNGSLDKYLYGQGNKPVLSWVQRFHIIKGIASGLLYLHEEWEKVVIHRDIKASNVLLDADMNGRLGDFGLARLYDHGVDPQTTHVVGTIGYLAPELASTGKATPLTDVFAFGIFILEVTCGRRPTSPIEEDSQGNQLMLVDWVLEHWQKGSLTYTVDIRLQDDYDVGEASMALRLGLLCSHPLADARPNMRQVMQYLEGEVPLPELMPPHLSFQMLALMQNEGFDSYAMSYPSSVANHSMANHCSLMSGLSGGRW